MIYLPRFFKIEELVPPQVFEDRGSKAWELLDDRALITLDKLRLRFGKITINNWKQGGDRMWSGLRTEDSPYGTRYSQHRFGRAFDCLFQEVTSKKVRLYVDTHRDEFEFIMSMELGTSWFHFDTRNCSRIKTYKP